MRIEADAAVQTSGSANRDAAVTTAPERLALAGVRRNALTMYAGLANRSLAQRACIPDSCTITNVRLNADAAVQADVLA